MKTWISKDANERRTEILDCSIKLFATKGFDNTSTTDIMNAVGIAKGTLYYHFKSKEEILDGIVTRTKENLVNQAKSVIENKTLSTEQKLIKTLISLKVQDSNEKKMFTEIHKPQNALMEQKMLCQIINDVTPLISEIIEEGNKESIFNCSYPYESAELFLVYGNVIFDSDYIELSEQCLNQKIKAFIANMELLLGAKKGSLKSIKKLFV